MQIAGGSARLDLHVDQSPQPDIQRGQSRRVHFRIGHERDIGLQFRRVLRNVLRDRNAAHLLFAFKEEFQIDRQGAVDGAQRFNGLNVRVHLALVVRRTAGIQIAVALGRLERRRFPEFEGVRRLHIEVAIAENGRPARRVQPIGIYQRVAVGLDQFNILQTRVFQLLRDELGRAVRVLRMLGQRGNAGDAQEIFQLFEKARFILPDIVVGCL